MDIKEFSEKYRLKIKKTGAEWVALGKYGELTEIDGEFRVRFMAVPRNASMGGKLRNRYRAAMAAGLTLKVKSGDAESIFLFDPDDAAQVKLAVRLVGARVRRKVSPMTSEQIERFKAVMAASRMATFLYRPRVATLPATQLNVVG